MIGGAVQADVAVLVVSARAGEFEAGFDRGGQTIEHLLIAKTTGVRYIIVVVNKMDDETVQWSRTRFEFIREKLIVCLLREIGYKRDDFIFIPIAALTGGNISEPCKELSWFQGPTLLAALDAVPQPARNEADAFRMPIIDHYVSRASLYVSGKIEKGVISESKAVVVMPSGVRGSVQGLFVEDAKIRTGVPGDNLRVMLRGVSMSDCPPGSVLCLDGDPCNVAEKVIVKLRLTTAAPDFMTSGFLAVCHIHTDIVQVIIDRLLEVLKPQDAKNPKFVKAGQIVRVVLKFERPVCVETFASFPQLGRFLLRYEGVTIGVGVVEKLPRPAAKS
jgi:peptide chain release factor subunit 3